VATQRGRWLAVTDAAVGNNRIVWVDAKSGGLRYTRTRLELDVDLSARTLTVRRNDFAVRHLSIGVGRAGSPTPTGTFAVTDKLSGGAYSAAYGCCILSLSATQPNLPVGWTGGNRIAIHGTLSASDFGRAVSAGCVHARDSDLRYLMRAVPLGTPVVIRR
jgi:lipoprotein-anchoring transpeptidase ErfK/SrfK